MTTISIPSNIPQERTGNTITSPQIGTIDTPALSKNRNNGTHDAQESQDATLERDKKRTEEMIEAQEEREEQERKRLERIKEASNDLLAKMNIQLDFALNRELNKLVVQVKNRETNEVIRQIPPEEMLELAKRMEEMSGMLLDKWS
jgi:flagellar protein FlaG